MAEARRRREQRYAAAMENCRGKGGLDQRLEEGEQERRRLQRQQQLPPRPVYRGPSSDAGGSTHSSAFTSSSSRLDPLVVFPSLMLSNTRSFDDNSSLGTGDGSQQSLLRKRVKDRVKKQQQRNRINLPSKGKAASLLSSFGASGSPRKSKAKALETSSVRVRVPKQRVEQQFKRSSLRPPRTSAPVNSNAQYTWDAMAANVTPEPPKQQQPQLKRDTTSNPLSTHPAMQIVGDASSSTAETTQSGTIQVMGSGDRSTASSVSSLHEPLHDDAVNAWAQQLPQNVRSRSSMETTGVDTNISQRRRRQLQRQSDMDAARRHDGTGPATTSASVVTPPSIEAIRQPRVQGSLLDSAYYDADVPSRCSGSLLDQDRQGAAAPIGGDRYSFATGPANRTLPATSSSTTPLSSVSAQSVRQKLQQRRRVNERGVTTPDSASPHRRIRFQLDEEDGLFVSPRTAFVSPSSITHYPPSSSRPPASILRSTGRYASTTGSTATSHLQQQQVRRLRFLSTPSLLFPDPPLTERMIDTEDDTTVQSAVAFIETVAAIVLQTAVRRWLVLRWVRMRHALWRRAAVQIQALARGALWRQAMHDAWERDQQRQRQLRQGQKQLDGHSARVQNNKQQQMEQATLQQQKQQQDEEEREWLEFQQLQLRKQEERRYHTPPSRRASDQTAALAPYDAAATVLQATFRGYWVRDCLHIDQYCAEIIQRAWRQWYRDRLLQRLQRASATRAKQRRRNHTGYDPSRPQRRWG